MSSGCVYFIWGQPGGRRYICVPRQEIREAKLTTLWLTVTLSGLARGAVQVPIAGNGNTEDDELDPNDVEPWTDEQQLLQAVTRSISPRIVGGDDFELVEWGDKMFEALLHSVDVDITFRWVGSTWEMTESRPT